MAMSNDDMGLRRMHFYVYENDRRMSFEELNRLGFYDDPLEED